MKKSKTFYLLPSTFYLLSLAKQVSAGPVQGVEQVLSGLGQTIIVIIQFITDIILDINSFDEFLFAKLIFLILIYLVIYVTIKKNDFFGDNKTIIKIITAAISILVIRFIPDEFIQIIFLQYSTLGATIGMFIPFIIILFFLHESNFGPLPRKIGWLTYGISYIAIFSYTYQDLQGIANYIYWSGIIGIIIAFFFDRQIHSKFGDLELQKAKHGADSERYAEIQDRITKIDEQLVKGNLPRNIQKTLEKKKKQSYKDLSKIIKDF